MPRRSSLSSVAELPVVDRNARAERIVRGPRGPALVFHAAVSSVALRALCDSASAICGSVGLPWRPPSPLIFRPDAAPNYSSALRLYALASSLAQIRTSRARATDLRWSCGEVRMGSSTLLDLPVMLQSPGPARPLQDVVVRALRAVRAENDLTALAVVVESAKVFESVARNTHPQPLLPYSLVKVSSPPVVPPAPVVLPDISVDLPCAALPTFGSSCVDGPVLPLPLLALLADRTHPGYSPDLPLRIFVEAVSAVMQRDWELATFFPVKISVTLREFLNWFYGSYDHWPTRQRWWPRFMAAAEALDRSDVRFPFDFEGHSGLLRVVSLSVIPRGPHCLDDEVTMDVQLPPGSSAGPPIDRSELRAWGLRSGVAYRALIGLAYYWHRPGHTLRRGASGVWACSDNPALYEPFSNEGLISLCYPTSRMRKRSVLLKRSLECFRVLHDAGVLRLLPDHRILPPATTAA